MESKKKNNVLIIIIILLLVICGVVLGYIYGKKSITPKAKFVKVMSNYLENNNIEIEKPKATDIYIATIAACS